MSSSFSSSASAQGAAGEPGGSNEEEEEACLLDALLSPLVAASAALPALAAPTTQDDITTHVWGVLWESSASARMLVEYSSTGGLQWDTEVARTIRTLLQPAPPLSLLVIQALLTASTNALHATSPDKMAALCEATAALMATLISKYRTQLMNSGAHVVLKAILHQCGAEQVVARSALASLER
jgi:hypothetical protein